MSSIIPKKSLGQHFLTDLTIAQRIVEALEPGKGGDVLEVGCGTGVLTQFLLRRDDLKLQGVEVDRESIAYLRGRFPDFAPRLIEGDFLKLDLAALFPGGVRIIGNFPYHISSQIFFKALEHRDRVPEVVGMVQREVAVRMAEPPGSRDYGILSALLQAWYDIEYLFTVHENVFRPPPKVKSAVIRLRRNGTTRLDCDEKLFVRVVKAAFGQRRKMLRNALKSVFGDFGGAEHPFFPMRAERLGVAAFVELTRWVEEQLSVEKEAFSVQENHAKNPTVHALFSTLHAPLKPLYGEAEAKQITCLVAERVAGLRREDVVLRPEEEVVFLPGFSADDLDRMIAELVAWRPVQYVVGRAWFAGRRFSVREGVLIPRPETEELVQWIVRERSGEKIRILDAGMGSGCIAVTLAQELPEAEIWGVDVSPEAFAVAQENAQALGAKVEFRQIDILNPPAAWVEEAARRPFDLIVSNPPYIPASVRSEISPHVVEHEPAEALFVDDANPLLFYRAIARLGRRIVTPGGFLYFEIFERMPEALMQMLSQEGYVDIELRCDIHDKPRMIRCRKA